MGCQALECFMSGAPIKNLHRMFLLKTKNLKVFVHLTKVSQLQLTLIIVCGLGVLKLNKSAKLFKRSLP